MGTIFLSCQWYYLADVFLFEREILELSALVSNSTLLTLAVLKRIYQQMAAETRTYFLTTVLALGTIKAQSFVWVLYPPSCRFLEFNI